MSTEIISFEDVLGMNARELANVMENGHEIDMEFLHNKMYMGVSLGLPDFMDKVLWKTFRKAFYFDKEKNHLSCLLYTSPSPRDPE